MAWAGDSSAVSQSPWIADLVGDVGDELRFRGPEFLGFLEGDPEAILFLGRVRDVAGEGQEPGRQAIAALDPFMHDADMSGRALEVGEVHALVAGALAVLDDLGVEGFEAGGRFRGQDILEGEVHGGAAVGQADEFVEVAAGVEDASRQVAQDDEVRRVIDERPRQAHLRARGQQGGAVDLRVVREDQPDLVRMLGVGLEDDADGFDFPDALRVAGLEDAAPSGPAGGGKEQGGGGPPVVEFEEEVVDVGAGFDPAAQGAGHQLVGIEHQPLAIAHQEGPWEEVRQRRKVRHTWLNKMSRRVMDTTIVMRKNT